MSKYVAINITNKAVLTVDTHLIIWKNNWLLYFPTKEQYTENSVKVYQNYICTLSFFVDMLADLVHTV